jgi:hypothetical protein
LAHQRPPLRPNLVPALRHTPTLPRGETILEMWFTERSPKSFTFAVLGKLP